MVIAGRLLADDLLDAAALVDALILDTPLLALLPEEITTQLGQISRARALVESAHGCVRTITFALHHHDAHPALDPTETAARITRNIRRIATRRLEPADQEALRLLLRARHLDQALLDEFTTPGFVQRLITAGMPLFRHYAGGFDLPRANDWGTVPRDSDTVRRFALALIEREQPLEAIALLLDAGDAEEAARLMAGVRESDLESATPHVVLNTLARIGPAVDQDPALLLRRVWASGELGNYDDVAADVNRAVSLIDDNNSALRRRVLVEQARTFLIAGQHDNAFGAAQQALASIKQGEESTYARAHEVLGECQLSKGGRYALQKAGESLRVAAVAWEACEEHAKARRCRSDLATGVLKALGLFDDALEILTDLAHCDESSEIERAWAALMEGFVLCDAGRLDGAEHRFRACSGAATRDNPRFIAAVAWGRMMVASRREDRANTLRFLTEAENTALDDRDDVFGVLFQCDAAESLGALGELDTADVYLRAASSRADIWQHEMSLARFVLDARKGHVGDLHAQLDRTPPFKRWLVFLVSAHAEARTGDLDRARRLLADCERELTALGFTSVEPLGEARTHNELQAMLAADQPAPGGLEAPAVSAQLWFGLLGAVETRRGDTTIDIGPHQRQSVLAVLLSAANHVVSTERLIDALWPEHAAPTSIGSLHSHISRLRRQLGADVIARRSGGYQLTVQSHQFDVTYFQQLSADGTRSIEAGDVAAGREQLARALALWRGDAYQDFAFDEWAQGERARLAEQHVSTAEARIDADLHLGRANDLIGELDALIIEHPTRERLCAQLMTALHHTNRQAEALTTYREYRTRLVEASGLEPSPQLRGLYDHILIGTTGPPDRPRAASG